MSSLGSYASSIDKSSTSFRTTVPMPIAKALKLKHQEKINWDLRIDEKGSLFVVITVES
jgi:hypothetical protein